MRTGELYQRYHGLYIGTVVDSDDEEGLGRVRVKMDQYEDSKDEPVYAAVARPVANGDTTVFFTPQAGDQVIVGYLAGDVNEPIILGYAHSKKGTPPSDVSAPNVHGIVTSIGRVTFDEAAKKIEVVFNGATPNTGSSITMDALGLRIHSDVQVVIEAPTGAVNLVAPALGFAGTPSFVPAVGALPPLNSPPSAAQMNFPGGLQVTTSGEFCVNGSGVVLTPFLDLAFATHVHMFPPTGGAPTGTAILPTGPASAALVLPPQKTVCVG